jgi:hypothetical protein
MFPLPVHDIRLAVDIGVYEFLEICLSGIGSNREVHILADQQIQLVEQTLIVSEPPATHQLLNLPSSDHRATEPTVDGPLPIMWPMTFICRSLPWRRT